GGVQLAGGHIDLAGRGVQPQPHPGRLQVGVGSVREVAPVGHLAGDVVGDAADGEVGVGVGGHHGELHARVDLAGPQRGADPRVASPDGANVHGQFPPVVGTLPSLAARTPSPASCGTTMPAAWAGVSAGYRNLMMSTPAIPPTTWAAMKTGAEDGAIPA